MKEHEACSGRMPAQIPVPNLAGFMLDASRVQPCTQRRAARWNQPLSGPGAHTHRDAPGVNPAWTHASLCGIPKRRSDCAEPSYGPRQTPSMSM